MIGKPSRATQPYRRGARVPGAALQAMLKGRPMGATITAADVNRAAALIAAKRRPRAKRKPRPPRPAR